METNFEKFAISIFFNNQGNDVTALMGKYSLKLKKGKTISDVVTAFNTGWRRGRGKFEREAREAGIELETVCEAVK